jgi:hypothetical protein
LRKKFFCIGLEVHWLSWKVEELRRGDWVRGRQGERETRREGERVIRRMGEKLSSLKV